MQLCPHFLLQEQASLAHIMQSKLISFTIKIELPLQEVLQLSQCLVKFHLKLLTLARPTKIGYNGPLLLDLFLIIVDVHHIFTSLLLCTFLTCDESRIIGKLDIIQSVQHSKAICQRLSFLRV